MKISYMDSEVLVYATPHNVTPEHKLWMDAADLFLAGGGGLVPLTPAEARGLGKELIDLADAIEARVAR